MPLPLPLGEVSPQVTERARTLTENRKISELKICCHLCHVLRGEIAQRQDEAAQDLGREGGKLSALVRCAALGGEQVAHALCVCLDAGVAAGGNILDAQFVGGSEQGREAGGFGILSGQSLGVEGDALHVQRLCQSPGCVHGGVFFGGVSQPDDRCRHGKALLLQDADTDEQRALLEQLQSVEQYVEMVLGYVRLDSGTKDLVIARYPLDEIIRKSIRKYAGQFIRRRIRLIYEGTDQIVLTDEKWLSFIIEQLLSNAVKYTLKGTVTITVSEEKKLTVTDTGMGIAPEDLPRIFEKGYTGYNGRMERKSTGIGLYLSQMAAKKLGHQITVESKLGEGSSFTIDLAEYPLRSE